MIDKEFILYVTPDKKTSVNITLHEQIKIITTKQFLKNYKISNFFKSKFFIKRLLKKIFKYHIKQQMYWKNDFWDKITLHVFKTHINLNNIKNIDDFEKKITDKTLTKRLNDIKKYQKKINSGNNNLGEPLFITSNALNYIGARDINNSVYILDGSRRIIANILNTVNPNILIIDID